MCVNIRDKCIAGDPRMHYLAVVLLIINFIIISATLLIVSIILEIGPLVAVMIVFTIVLCAICMLLWGGAAAVPDTYTAPDTPT